LFLSFGIHLYLNIKALKRILLCLALLLPFLTQAQQHHEIGLTAGVSNYYGDLQNKLFPSTGYKAMGGIYYKYFMSPHVGVRFGFNFTEVTGADSLSDVAVNKQRNLSFASPVAEGYGALEINLLPIDIDRMKITPYIFGGIGVFYYDPYTAGLKGEKVFLRPLSTEGQGIANYPDRKTYKHLSVAFPFGGGLKFLIGNTLVVTTEIGFRYTNTDYLDDVSKSYVNLDTLTKYKGKQSADLSYRGNTVEGADPDYYPDYKYQRGDSKANDWYWFGNVGIAVYFRALGNRRLGYIHCPRFFKIYH
jgi:hypothetical protein